MVKGRRASDRRKEREGRRASDTVRDRVGDPPSRIDMSADTAFLEKPRTQSSRLSQASSQVSSSVQDPEATRMSVAKKRPPRGAQLFVIDGPFAGGDAVVEHTPCVVGRNESSGISLDDEHLSRNHFELRFNAKERTWKVADLGSSSGTLKNGHPISGELTPIAFGDVLHAGGSVFRFLWNQRIPDVDTPKKKREREEKISGEKKRGGAVTKKRLFIALGVLLSIALVVGAVSLVRWRAKVQQDRLNKASIAQLIVAARGALEEGDVEKAQKQIQAAQDIDASSVELQSAAKEVSSELDAFNALKEAEKALKKGDAKSAKSLLATIADTSQIREARDTLYAKANGVARRESEAKTRRLINERKFDEAQEAVEYHTSRFPSDPEGEALRALLQKQRGTAAPDSKSVSRAKKAFRKGDLEGAAAAVKGASASDAVAYASALNRFKEERQRGLSALRQKSARSKPPLSTAYTLADRLGGGRPKSALTQPMVNALYLAAIASKQRGESCTWANNIRQASRLNKSDKKVIVQKRLVAQKAEAGLLRSRAFEGAKRKSTAKASLCYATPGSKTYKALKKLAR